MTDKDNVVVLALHSNNGIDLTPKQLLEEVLREIDDENSTIYKNKKILILCLNDENQFTVRFRQCGLKCSEMLSMLTVCKQIIFKLMGY